MSDNLTIRDYDNQERILRATEVALNTYVPHHRITQDVVSSANNSTETNLAVGNSYTFTGEAESTLGVAAIQVSLFADKNCLLKVQQSPDGTNWDLSDLFVYTANGNFGITVQAIASYVRVVVSSANETTTVFRLQTVLCPVVEVLPRALTQYGSLRVSAPVDEHGFRQMVSPYNESVTTHRTRLAGAVFDGALDANYWATSVSTGTVAVSGIEAVVTSGTANGHFARLYSVTRARFSSGSALKARTNLRIADTGTANVKRRWGIAWGATMPTITDGAYFELNGTTFSVVTMKGGSENRISNGSFNGHGGTTVTPTFTVNNVYEILYTTGSVWFFVNDILLHKVTASAASWVNTVSFHIWADASNSGNSSAVAMYFRSTSIYRLGDLHTQPKSYNVTGNAATHTLKLGGGILHRIIFNNTAGTSFIIYDSTTGGGTKIGDVTTSTAALGSWTYDVPFNNGLVIVTTGNGLDLTVVFE